MTVAISTGPITHLDHLAPLCEMLDIPLIVVEREQVELGALFYPMIEIQYVPLSRLTLKYIASRFDTIITCGKFWAMELKPLLELLHKKKVRFVFAPHGMSDKEELLSKSVNQDVQLIYGPLTKTNALHHIEMGNIRLGFYEKHRAHFDELADPFFQTEKKTVLYAPTWKTKATSSSFFTDTGRIIEQLSDEYNLLIKLHPLLEENDLVNFHRIIGRYEDRATFIENFPPVYPLLDRTDVYLGDFSSVGYDFLHYDRPMYFLQEGGRLSRCGKLFEGKIEEQSGFSRSRKELYENAFGHEKAPLLKAGLEKITQQLLRK